MKEPLWLLPEVVIAVQRMLIAEHGGAAGIRDDALLASAMARPRQRFTYANDVSIFDLATSYCYGLAKNHLFVDGNKRISLTAAVLFLEINGYLFSAPEADAAIMIESLAASDIDEQALSMWLGEWSILQGG